MEKKQRRAPKKISQSYLENAALHYLGRYAASTAQLRRVLGRRIEKSCKHHGTAPDQFTPIVESIIARYTASGLLDDKSFALAKTQSLRRQGLSKQAIQAKLGLKGLSAGQISSALQQTDTSDSAELDAARHFTKRKKIGPYRKTAIIDPKKLQKEMAAMARAGFSYDIARQALNYTENDED